MPSLFAPANSFKKITNFLLRDNRIVAAPQNSLWPPWAPMLSFNEVLMQPITYLDQQANWHTILLTKRGIKEVSPPTPILSPNAFWNDAYPVYDGSNLFSYQIYQNQAFFSNGYIPLTMHKGDGRAYPVGPMFTPPIPDLNPIGDFPGACFFLGKLASRLLALYTVEPYPGVAGSTPYPSRVRWCAVNNPFEWDSSVDETAGVLTIPEVEDQISGFVTINQTGFIFRQAGITPMSATGSDVIPFFIESYSVGPVGVGCSIPFTLSSYGALACFVSADNVYMFTGSAPQPIGTNARRSIFKDLAAQSSQPFGQMVGTFGNYIDYLTYWLAIPQNNDTTTSVWIYHFDDNTWINEQLPYGALRCIGNVAVA